MSRAWSEDAVVAKVTRACRAKGYNGIRDLAAEFRAMDVNNDRVLSKKEFSDGLTSRIPVLTKFDIDYLFRAYDTNGDGRVDVTEFIQGLRLSVSPGRLAAIDHAFFGLPGYVAATRSVPTESIIGAFRTEEHPSVLEGSATADMVEHNFLTPWRGGAAFPHQAPEGHVHREEFASFWAGVSAFIADDNDFCRILSSVYGAPASSDIAKSTTVLSQPAMDEREEIGPFLAGYKSTGETIEDRFQSKQYVALAKGSGVRGGTDASHRPYAVPQPIVSDVYARSTALGSSRSVAARVPPTKRLPPPPPPPAGAQFSAASLPPPRSMTHSVFGGGPANRTRLPALPANVAAAAKAPFKLKPSGDPVLDALRERVVRRAGGIGFRGLRRALRTMDSNGNGKLSPHEFSSGIRRLGIALEGGFARFDRDSDGSISLEEFMRTIIGDGLSPRRAALVETAYSRLDKTGDGIVNFEDLNAAYDASQHPDVLAGKATPTEILLQFASSWDKDLDGTVTLEEFKEYYMDLGATIIDDDYFELMIRNAWHISGA